MAFQPDKWASGPSGGTPITPAELNRIEAAGAAASAAPAWGDVAGKPSAFPPADHAHAADDVSSGTFAAARIPTLAQSKVTGLTAALDGKADAADLAALVSRVEALESAAEPEA